MKTVVDAMAPAARALGDAVRLGAPLRDALEAAARAAAEAAEYHGSAHPAARPGRPRARALARARRPGRRRLRGFLGRRSRLRIGCSRGLAPERRHVITKTIQTQKLWARRRWRFRPARALRSASARRARAGRTCPRSEWTAFLARSQHRRRPEGSEAFPAPLARHVRGRALRAREPDSLPRTTRCSSARWRTSSLCYVPGHGVWFTTMERGSYGSRRTASAALADAVVAAARCRSPRSRLVIDNEFRDRPRAGALGRRRGHRARSAQAGRAPRRPRPPARALPGRGAR